MKEIQTNQNFENFVNQYQSIVKQVPGIAYLVIAGLGVLIFLIFLFLLVGKSWHEKIRIIIFVLLLVILIDLLLLAIALFIAFQMTTGGIHNATGY